MRNHLLLLASGTLALAITGGCTVVNNVEERGNLPVPQPVTEKVTAATGGTVKASDGTQVSIPPGALASDQTITITATTSAPPPSGGTAVSNGYIFGPDGLKFLKPITVTLAYDPTLLPAGTSASSLVVYTAPGTTSDYAPLPSSVGDSTHIVATTTHFCTDIVASGGPTTSTGVDGGFTDDAAGLDAKHDATVPMDAGHEATAPVEADLDSSTSSACPLGASACADGNVCGANDDCESQVCTAGICAVPACSPTCTEGANCGASDDCGSQVCKNGICGYPTCSSAGGGSGCLDGDNCGEMGDCESDVCTAGKCAPPACASMSGACPQGSKCGAAADCGSDVCETGGKCVPPACSPTCPTANACGAALDCASKVCTAGECM